MKNKKEVIASGIIFSCRKCGETISADSWRFICPDCGQKYEHYVREPQTISEAMYWGIEVLDIDTID